VALLRRLTLDLVYAIVAVVTAPFWMRKARGDWRERFGHPPADLGGTGSDPGAADNPPKPHLLIHAVSVGEVNLTVPMIRTLIESSSWQLTLSVTTDTGIARARSLFADQPEVRVVRYPLDASWAVRRFLNRLRPDGLILVELEIWPNMLDECRRRGIPVGVVNGRLSERSFKGYRRARPVLKRYFSQLSFAAVQDEDYAARFGVMGVPADRLHVAGSMKWDSADLGVPSEAASELGAAMGIDRTRPLVVGGSTAPGEHELLVEALDGLDCQLLCAPRRPEWFDQASEALGPDTVRRSAPGSGNPKSGRFLLDTIGELRAAYALADLVVVGRSFGDLAGSDPMEPAALGKPVIIGPAHGDFVAAVRALERAGGLLVVSREEFGQTVARLIRDRAERDRLGANGAACVRGQAGATQRHAELVERHMRRGR